MALKPGYCNAATMADENVSKEEKQNTFMIEQLYCSTGITDAIRGQLTFISALNALLAIAAFIGNALIQSFFARSLHFIRRPNTCFVALQQLISVLVLLLTLYM